MTKQVDGAKTISAMHEGMGALQEYEKELFYELDLHMDRLSVVAGENADFGKIKKYNDSYKSALSKLSGQMGQSLGYIDQLVEQAKSGKIKDVEGVNRELQKTYGTIINSSAQFYSLIDPQITQDIVKIYAIKGGVPSSIFTKGCKILKDYFLGDEMIAKIKGEAASAQGSEMPLAA
ncbi:MAG: hypothetical protein NTU57_00255 [Candidatus Aenigmarchaeota archaeon]|nr:hypothetical protein [Candidatus Aenigmarchaeota archaeon]